MAISGHITGQKKISSRRSFHIDWRGFFTTKITVARWQINVFGLTAFSLGALVGGYLVINHLFSVQAASSAWNLNSGSNYTFDNTKIEFTGGVAQLKATGTPGADWIADDGGGHRWGHRRQMTIDITGNSSIANGYVVNGSISGSTASDIYNASLSNGDDFRVVYWDGATSAEVMRYLVSFTSSSINFYFKTQAALSANDTTHYFIYYGNSSATAPTVDVTQIFNTATNAALSASSAVASASDSYSSTPITLINDGFADGTHAGWGNNNVASSRVMIKLPTARKVWKIKQYWGGDNTGGWAKPAGTYFPATYQVQYTTDNTAVASDTAGSAKWTSMTLAANSLTVSRIDTTDYTPTYAGSPSLSGSTVTTNFNGCSNCWGTSMVHTFLPTSSLAIRLAIGNTTWIGSMGEFFVYPINATDATVEPTLTFGSQTEFYPTSNPTIVPTVSQGYSTLSAFAQTLGSGSSGTIQYQISPDGGGSWYYWTGAVWATASGYAQSNSAATINSNMVTFTAGTNPKTFTWKSFLNSNGSQLPKLDQIDLTYVWDTQAPDNPSSVAATASNGGAAITTATWYNHPAPYFTWSTPNDNADTGAGETASGTAGYYVYFGKDATANPVTAGTYQTGATYTVSGLTDTPAAGPYYYLRLKTKDNAGNVTTSAADLFIYRYDTASPTNPTYVATSPAGYSAVNSFSFIWPTTSDPQSGLATAGGYCYKTGAAGATDTCTTTTLVNGIEAYQTGANIFYLRVKDEAGNTNPSYVQVTYYYNPDAPSVSQNLTVTPSSNTKNSFAFSWDKPATYKGQIAGYRYSVNAKPTTTNTTATTLTSLTAGPYATQVGENTFYVVAQDDSGNINYDNPASVTFTAQTAAPGAPLNVTITDASDRKTGRYALTISWDPPSSLPDDFGGYIIERAETEVSASGISAKNELSYVKIADVSTTIYSDAGLAPTKTYVYRIKTRDTTSNVSAVSSSVSKVPTGKFTDPPAITKGPSIEAKSTSATVTWTTDRAGTSLVQCGLTTAYGLSAGQLDAVTEHSVAMKGLTPGATYHCRVQTTDVPELVDYSTTDKGFSDDVLFKTLDAPGLTDITVSDISLSAAIVSWKSNVVASSRLVYGTSLSYGQEVTDVSNSQVTNHAVRLKGLTHSTPYHFRIKSTDAEGNLLQSDDYVFETLKMPTASKITMQPVTNQATATMDISWETNVPTTSVVFYHPEEDKTPVETAKAALDTKHTVRVTNLLDDTPYLLTVSGRDGYGNTVASDQQRFHTATDSRPPIISNVTIETQVQGNAEEAKAQVIVSWNTDEPGSSQVEYGPGLSADSYPNQTVEDGTLTNSHVVVISELKPAQTYHLRVKTHDRAGNSSVSGDNVVITGRASSSVLNIILQNLQRTFGWLGGLGW